MYVQFVGVVTGDDFVAARAEAASQPGFDPTFDLVLDLRRADLSGLTSSYLRSLASSTSLTPDSRRAIVVNSAVHYGIVRMYQLQRENAGGTESSQVFTDLAEALTWLGLEDLKDRLDSSG